MGYFSNGTEGMLYMDQYCCRCVNMRDLDDGRGAGCAVWDVHVLTNYDQIENKDLTTVLDTLIPRTKDQLSNEECTMFLLDEMKPDPNQVSLFEEEQP